MIAFNLIPLLPEIFIAICAAGFLMVGAWRGNESTPVIAVAGMLACAMAAAVVLTSGVTKAIVLNGMFTLDGFAGFMKVLILGGLAVSLILSAGYLRKEKLERIEYPVLVLFAGLGMLIMVSASNMLSLYMALELQSLSLYVLAAFNRNSYKSSEAGVKYFILGALSSGMILFGISLIYGFTGSLDFTVIKVTLMTLTGIPLGFTFGLVFLLSGLVFKLSAVPFHMWTPDVYQGAPTSVTALFALVPKLAAAAMLIRILFGPFSPVFEQWSQIIFFVSAASMIVGAFAGVAQSDIKRLMAYSSIGNVGYLLMGIAAGTQQGVAGVMTYLVIYAFGVAGTFAVLLCLRRGGAEFSDMQGLKGISRTNPVIAYALAIFLFSMAGIPPMAGFFGKLVVFQAAVEQQMYVLAVLGVLTSVVSAYYYLKVVKIMFFDEGGEPLDTDVSFGCKVVMAVAAVFTLAFCLKPSAILAMSAAAASSLFM